MDHNPALPSFYPAILASPENRSSHHLNRAMNLTRNRQRFCDGISRRQMLQIGAAGLAGLNLPDILGAEARTGRGSSEKSVIHIFLQGGPSHLDMVDLKPEAPANIRGPFKSIPTAIPGIHFCEYMPKLAKLAK